MTDPVPAPIEDWVQLPRLFMAAYRIAERQGLTDLMERIDDLSMTMENFDLAAFEQMKGEIAALRAQLPDAQQFADEMERRVLSAEDKLAKKQERASTLLRSFWAWPVPSAMSCRKSLRQSSQAGTIPERKASCTKRHAASSSSSCYVRRAFCVLRSHFVMSKISAPRPCAIASS